MPVHNEDIAAASYGAALYYFTGSRSHNIAVRRIAQRQGLKIKGVLISINSDAHSIVDFDNLRFGIGVAGWLGKQDVLNTRPLSELRKLLAGTR